MIKKSDALRNYAENCLHLAEEAADKPAAARYRRMAEAWIALANEQDWLDGYPPHKQTERASDLAESTIDKLSDDVASSAEVNERKSQLIEGPAEFRDDRVDND